MFQSGERVTKTTDQDFDLGLSHLRIFTKGDNVQFRLLRKRPTFLNATNWFSYTRADLGGGCRGCAPPPEMTFGFLIQLVFCKKKMWVIGVEVEQETSAPPPEKNPGSAPATK